MLRTRTGLSAVILLQAAVAALAADWPQWKQNAGHLPGTPEELPARLHLQWVRQLPAPGSAWPWTQYFLQFDASYEPVVMGKSIFVGSMVRDSVTAYDTGSGEEKWRFYANAPVRFAPVANDGKLYVGSDDGCLSCLDAASGEELWKLNAGPPKRKWILGNGRLISTHPVRGAPCLAGDRLYFAAGVYPFMGTFIHAYDTVKERLEWTNSGSGSVYILQPHHSPAFAGVSPQGYLTASDTVLVVPGGRSVPAGYDATTGRFLWHDADTKDGGYEVNMGGGWVYHGGDVIDGRNGRVCSSYEGLITPTGAYVNDGGTLRVHAFPPEQTTHRDRKGRTESAFTFRRIWSAPIEGLPETLHLKAGQRLYGADEDGSIKAIDVASKASARVSWAAKVEGEVWRMLAADGKLFVVTRKGAIYCFGGERRDARRHELVRTRLPDGEAHLRAGVEAIIAECARSHETGGSPGLHEGYCVLLGLDEEGLATELLRMSDFHIVVVEKDAARANAFRRKMDAAGLYGDRISVIVNDPLTTRLPPYLANLVIVTDAGRIGLDGEDDWQAVFRTLRPYGGLAVIRARHGDATARREQAAEAGLPGAVIRVKGKTVTLSRAGPLPGADNWSHQYANIANTVSSRDTVKAPLGLLWFGGPSNRDVLPRHGHGPTPQVVDGKLIIQGIGVMNCRDVYTGRVLWQRRFGKEELNTFGMYYDRTYKEDPFDRTYNQVHIPGANEYGANYCTASDAVYLINGAFCHVLDINTGRTRRKIELPPREGVAKPNWGFVGVSGELLIAGAEPVDLSRHGVRPNHHYGTGSRRLVVMNRHTGKVLWQRLAAHNFRHNSIVAGNGKLFLSDRFSRDRLKAGLAARRGKAPAMPDGPPTLLALDLDSGREIWKSTRGLFGTWLGYSAEHDTLVEGGSRAGDRAGDETGRGMTAYRGADGKVLWSHDEEYSGPPILHGDRITTQTGGPNLHSPPATVYSLKTGAPVSMKHPLTGERIPWRWVRFKGCNTAVAGRNLLLFRSASAAFIDLTAGSGTASLGGFKSGCTSNLIPANGVLNAPDYTRTCVCSYQVQASLALVHDPDNEYWSFDAFPGRDEPAAVRRAGINLGAAGNRYGPGGTLWTEFPSAGGPSPDLPVRIHAGEARWLRKHSSLVEGGLNWIGSSGVAGAERIAIRVFLQPRQADSSIHGWRIHHGRTPSWRERDIKGRHPKARPHTVRLYFAELELQQPGRRLFEVSLQQKRVLESFDIIREAGRPGRTIMREFHGVLIKDDLLIDMKPAAAASHPPLLCGVEILSAPETR